MARVYQVSRLLKRLALPASMLLVYNLHSVLLELVGFGPFTPRTFAVNESTYSALPYTQVCRQLYCTNRHVQNANDTSRMTVVSAYFDIGPFRKGGGDYFSSNLYIKWMKTYRLLLNDVIMFTDEPRFLDAFREARSSSQQRTCFCLVRREALWSFRLLPLLANVLNQTNYPHYSPNTIVPEYGAVMHSKYAILQLAIEWNPFGADTFAWSDIGIFRLLTDEATEPPFFLHPPSNFDDSRVAFTQIDSPDFSLDVADYFKRNRVWIAGGFFVAKSGVMTRWIEQYRAATFALLRMGLSDTDQQTIYAMYTPALSTALSRRATLVHVQSYAVQSSDRINGWFYLPFRSRLDWFRTGCRNAHQCVHVTVRMHDCDKPAGLLALLFASLFS